MGYPEVQGYRRLSVLEGGVLDLAIIIFTANNMYMSSTAAAASLSGSYFEIKGGKYGFTLSCNITFVIYLVFIPTPRSPNTEVRGCSNDRGGKCVPNDNFLTAGYVYMP